MSERATCASTSRLRRLNRCSPPPGSAVPSLISVTRLGRDALSAGTRPKSRPVTSVAPAVNRSTRQSGVVSRMSAGRNGGRAASSSCWPQYESGSASRPPTAARARLSTSSWRTMRARVAPRARRSAISRRRVLARASSRFATLLHATSRTRATIVISMPTASRTFPPFGPRRASATVSTRTVRPRLSVGYSCSSWLASVVMLARACSTLTPGSSRATTCQTRPRLDSKFSSRKPVSTCWWHIVGSHATGRAKTLMPRNPCGATPTTVKSCRLSVIVFPTTAGSPAKYRCHPS